MTWTERMRDAAYAINIPATWTGAVGGYMNGGDPFHPWSSADWQRFPHNRKLPIFVRSNVVPALTVWDDAFMALRDCYALNIPHGSYVALDRETCPDTAQATLWANIMRWGSYKPVQYHSESTMSAPGFNWDWIAWYKGIGPFMAPKPAWITQYKSGKLYDSSTVRPWLYWYGSWWR
jgi:hypothetical protein